MRFDEGGHLLVKHALRAAVVGEEILVTGSAPDLEIHRVDRDGLHLDQEVARTGRRRLDFDVDQGFLAGRVVTVARTLLDPKSLPWIEHEGKIFPLHAVDPIKNSRRKRGHRQHQTTVRIKEILGG